MVLASGSVWARLLMFVILNLLVFDLMLLQLGLCSLLLSIIVTMGVARLAIMLEIVARPSEVF